MKNHCALFAEHLGATSRSVDVRNRESLLEPQNIMLSNEDSTLSLFSSEDGGAFLPPQSNSGSIKQASNEMGLGSVDFLVR